jgi:hypothetical protein
VILLSDDLRVGLFPQWHSAGVIAVTMSENDVPDRGFVIGGQQIVMLARVQRDRRVYDDITFAGLDQERVAEALNHADRFVDLDHRVAVSEEVRWVLGDHPLLGVCGQLAADRAHDKRERDLSEGGLHRDYSCEIQKSDDRLNANVYRTAGSMSIARPEKPRPSIVGFIEHDSNALGEYWSEKKVSWQIRDSRA